MPQNYESFPREVRERFDIVSWDPRGIGNSTAVNCFASPRKPLSSKCSREHFSESRAPERAWMAATASKELPQRLSSPAQSRTAES
ncbi:hypothetical protein SALBM311S_10116 [Streptomyces alboniger]